MFGRYLWGNMAGRTSSMLKAGKEMRVTSGMRRLTCMRVLDHRCMDIRHFAMDVHDMIDVFSNKIFFIYSVPTYFCFGLLCRRFWKCSSSLRFFTESSNLVAVGFFGLESSRWNAQGVDFISERNLNETTGLYMAQGDY